MFAALAQRGRLLYVARAEGRGQLQVRELDGGEALRVQGPLADEGETLEIGGLAVSEDGRIYVSDTGLCQLRVFHAFGGSSGRIGPSLARTVPRDRRGILAWPKGLVLDDDGRLWIACGRQAWVHGLQLYLPDGSFVDSVASTGERTRTWAAPTGLALHEGLVWVCDTLEDRLQVVRARGQVPIAVHELGRDRACARPLAIAVHAGHRDLLAREPREGVWRYDREMKLSSELRIPGGVEGACDLCALPDGSSLLCDRHGARLVTVDAEGRARELPILGA